MYFLCLHHKCFNLCNESATNIVYNTEFKYAAYTTVLSKIQQSI